MVAEQDDDQDASSHRKNAISQNAILNAQSKTLPRWRPRSGKNEQHTLMLDALTDALRDVSIDPTVISYSMPTKSQVAKGYPKVKEPQLTQHHLEAVEEFVAQGNLIYRLLKPALIIDGPHHMDDLREINDFVDGLNGDGRGLLQWALQWSDDSTFENQKQINADLKKIKFYDAMSAEQFYTAARDFYELW